MRPIHVVRLDKARPALILTRSSAIPYLTHVTVAPITSTIRGIVSEVPLSERNGLDHDSVASLDNVTTVPVSAIGRLIGFLEPEDETTLTAVIERSFDLH
jgi:mRNA interferase MazF